MNERSSSTFLSKSQFIRGMQCHKSLYLHKYCSELRDEITPEQEAIFESGTEVGILAQLLFPGGIEVPYEGFSIPEQLQRTFEEIERGTETIYEASFRHDDIFIKVDILRFGTRGWEIYEVKSSTEVKDVHVYDAALQYHILQGTGVPVVKVAVVHINKGYERLGELEIDKLFTIEDVTGAVQELQDVVTVEIDRQREMLQGDQPPIDIGPYCSDPYECDFRGHCWQHIPEDSIFDLRGRGVNKFDLYREGIIRLEDIPLERLNAAQRFQVEKTLQRKDAVNQEKLQEFLGTLWHPLCFLDFETFMTAIPPFEACRPYQQIPFQYSLHIQNYKGGELEHYEYLARPGIDPREELLAGLLVQIPDDACILTYNKAFEISVLKNLGTLFQTHRQSVERFIPNIRDLMVLFRSRDVYCWQMKGSYSIKEVLPALVPDLSYEGLEVAHGRMAMEAYHRMCATEEPQEVERIRTALLEYCKLDTIAMVRILERLRELVK